MIDKIALIIGRFQPFHLGHLSLIKRYSKAGFFIKIAIGSSNLGYKKENPLSSQEREEIIKKAMKEFKVKKYKIYKVPDIHKNSNYVKYVLDRVGRFDTIVTGNPRTLKLFVKYKSKRPWNIESFEESLGRPGGNITSGEIRKRWLKSPSRKHLPKSTFDYLKSINFSDRLRKIKNN